MRLSLHGAHLLDQGAATSLGAKKEARQRGEPRRGRPDLLAETHHLNTHGVDRLDLMESVGFGVVD